MQPVLVARAVAELRSYRLVQRRVQAEPGDLVLVLVGRELVQVLRDGPGKRLAAGDGGLAGPHALDEAGVLVRAGLVLERGQFPDAQREHVREVPLGRARVCLGGGGGRCRFVQRPARAERPDVGVDGHAVEPDGVLDRLGAGRQRARLVGGAHQDHVGVLLIAEQVGGQRRRVEEAGRAHLRLDRGRDPAGRGEVLADVHHHLPGWYLGGGDHGHRPVLAHGAQLGPVGGDEGVTAEVQVAFAVAELGGSLGRPGADAQVGHDRAALLRQAGLVEGAHLAPVGGEGGAEDLRDGHHAGAADAGDAHGEPVRAEEPLGLLDQPPATPGCAGAAGRRGGGRSARPG